MESGLARVEKSDLLENSYMRELNLAGNNLKSVTRRSRPEDISFKGSKRNSLGQLSGEDLLLHRRQPKEILISRPVSGCKTADKNQNHRKSSSSRIIDNGNSSVMGSKLEALKSWNRELQFEKPRKETLWQSCAIIEYD